MRHSQMTKSSASDYFMMTKGNLTLIVKSFVNSDPESGFSLRSDLGSQGILNPRERERERMRERERERVRE